MTQKYRVRLSRTSLSDCSVEVEAEDRKAAEHAAVKMAEQGEVEWFLVDDGEIEIEGITELNE
jgi:hypothetical protein